jgi:hypothetical protein
MIYSFVDEYAYSQLMDVLMFHIMFKAGTEPVIASPIYYFVSEVLRSSSTSQDVQSVENVKKREHVYNTMFHVPWRCELVSPYHV